MGDRTMLAGPRPGTRLCRLIGVTPLLALLSAAPAFAQPTAPGPAAAQGDAQGDAQGGGTGGVVRPPAQVDPGMVRPTPSLPAQSTPVIHPRRLHKSRHGVQVVPK